MKLLDTETLTALDYEIARKAVEDVLVDMRDSRLSMLGRGNGLVIAEKDGTGSSIIRLGAEDAVRIGIKAIVEARAALQPSGVGEVEPGHAICDRCATSDGEPARGTRRCPVSDCIGHMLDWALPPAPQPPKIRIDASDPGVAATWTAVEQSAAPVADWPTWKKLGSGLLTAEGDALPPSPMERIFGKWPGDETDEEIAAAFAKPETTALATAESGGEQLCAYCDRFGARHHMVLTLDGYFHSGCYERGGR